MDEPWLCACGEMTVVTHWAWPNGVGVHDPELAYLEAAGLAQQGPTGPANNEHQPTRSEAECTRVFHHSGCCEKGPGPVTYKADSSASPPTNG